MLRNFVYFFVRCFGRQTEVVAKHVLCFAVSSVSLLGASAVRPKSVGDASDSPSLLGGGKGAGYKEDFLVFPLFGEGARGRGSR